MATYSDRPLEVQRQEIRGKTVIFLKGSLSTGSVDRVNQEFADVVRLRSPATVVELSDLDFIGSAGLGSLINLERESKAHKGTVRLVNPQPGVRGVLDTTRLTQFFEVYSNLDDALAP